MRKPPKIINRGRGPELEGTRITVYNVYEYSRLGRPRDYIAAALFLSSAQVQVVLDYIAEHEEEIRAEFDDILARIRQGNPQWVEELLKQNRAKRRAVPHPQEKEENRHV